MLNFSFVKTRGDRIVCLMLCLGLFVQISGAVWFESNSAKNAQVYIWLLLPALVNMIGAPLMGRRITVPSGYVPWIGMLIWIGLSTLWSSSTSSEMVALAKRGVFILCFLVAVRMLYRRRPDLLFRTLCLGATVVALGALATILYQFMWLGKPLSYRAYRVFTLGIGAYADYGWPVAAGIFHGSLAIWMLGAITRKGTSRRMAAGLCLVFAILVVYTVMTYTRGAWAALVLAGALVLVMQRTPRANVFALLGGILAVGIVVGLHDRLFVEFTERQLTGRSAIWAHFFSAMPGHWLIGHGLGTPFEYKWPTGDIVSPHAHSLFLQQIYDSGLVSLGFMGIGLFMLSVKAWRRWDHPWVKLAFPVLVFALISMLTDVERIYTRPGDYWTVFWLPVAILLAVSRTEEEEAPATDVGASKSV